MTNRPAYTVTLARRLHERATAGDTVESYDLEWEGRTVVSRPTEEAARKAAEMYGWDVVDTAGTARRDGRGGE